MFAGRGLCVGLITRPEESYRLWCVVVCDLETSRMRRPWPALGRSAKGKKKHSTYRLQVLLRKHNCCFSNCGWTWFIICVEFLYAYPYLKNTDTCLNLEVVATLARDDFFSDVHRAVHRNIISIAKLTNCTSLSNLFYFGMTLYMFQTVFPSVITSSNLYIQQQTFVRQILLYIRSLTPVDCRNDRPKHVECHYKIK